GPPRGPRPRYSPPGGAYATIGRGATAACARTVLAANAATKAKDSRMRRSVRLIASVRSSGNSRGCASTAQRDQRLPGAAFTDERTENDCRALATFMGVQEVSLRRARSRPSAHESNPGSAV